MIVSFDDFEHARALVRRRLGLEFRGPRVRDLGRAIAQGALAEDSLPPPQLFPQFYIGPLELSLRGGKVG